jgi:UDP-N-acetylglucosamine 2-epimerase (non-hydrolysing)
MKVLTVLGTRPEIIRLSLIIEKLDRLCDHKLVHTGQNFDPNLSDVFFHDLGVRAPDYYLGAVGETFGQEISQILSAFDKVLSQERPDALLILGDTNSGLCSILAKRMGIPVYHMEAGNRCYDDRVPEEVNRRIIDHSSDILMPYTQRSKENLVREGIERDRIFVVGNPIYEVLNVFDSKFQESGALNHLELLPQQYFLATVHRAENVDDAQRLGNLLEGFSSIAETYKMPMVVSTHPHTADKIHRFGLCVKSERVRLIKPIGFFDFIALERKARCVLTDSGTVQEECCIFGIPNVTTRDVTERAETLECGSNMLSSADPRLMLESVKLVLSSPCEWRPPEEYLEKHVSHTVAKIVLGYTTLRKRG